MGGAGEVVQNKEKALFLFAASAGAAAQRLLLYQLGRKAADGAMSISRDKLLQEDAACS